MRKVRIHIVLILLVVAGWPRSARSTTFVLLDDLTMLRSSDVVLVGTVTGIESAAVGSDGAIYTYIHLQPERVLKGAISAEPIVVREPGGTVGDRTEWIFGAPEFWVGERSLLFLSQNPDGTLQTNNLSMGKFSVGVDSAGHTTLTRDFGVNAELYNPGSGALSAAQPETRRFGSFVRRLRRLMRSEPASSPRHPLTLRPTELDTAQTQYQDAYTFLSNPPARWFEPDSGQPVSFLVDATGDNTLGFTATRAAVDSAFGAWTNVPTSNLILADGGTTPPGTFNQCTTNRIIFNDPNGEVTDPSGCGGTLAIGGYCSGAGTTVVNGTTFARISVGKVTFNNGWGACSFWNQCNVAEVATHEIGHTIGLGHSADTSATMAAVAHFDGRCAGLRNDDVAGVSFIYPQIGSPAPTVTPTPRLTSTATASRTPTRTPTPSPTATPILTATPTRTLGPPTFTPVPNTPTATRPPTATPLGAPVNNTCSTSTVIGATPFTDVVVTIAATSDASDPAPSCGNGSRGHSVWYQFTAPSAGSITADTFGSTYDTILSAYTGTCGSFRSIACNDDSGGRLQSQVSFTATAGTTYYFMPTAYSGTGGTLTFHLSFQPAAGSTPVSATATPTSAAAATFTNTPLRTLTSTPVPTFTNTPAAAATATSTSGPLPTSTSSPLPTSTSSAQLGYDTCGGATGIGAVPYSNTVLTNVATSDATDPYPSCSNRSRLRSVWYRYTPATSGTVTADTFGSNYDTILSVYTGTCGALVQLVGGCNDDASGRVQSQLSFNATAGTTYYLMVTAYSGAGGSLVFNVR